MPTSDIPIVILGSAYFFSHLPISPCVSTKLVSFSSGLLKVVNVDVYNGEKRCRTSTNTNSANLPMVITSILFFRITFKFKDSSNLDKDIIPKINKIVNEGSNNLNSPKTTLIIIPNPRVNTKK